MGLLLRTIRRRVGYSQAQLSAEAGVPREDIIRIENGRVGEFRLERTRRVLATVGGRARLTAWWNGAAADRLLDARRHPSGIWFLSEVANADTVSP